MYASEPYGYGNEPFGTAEAPYSKYNDCKAKAPLSKHKHKNHAKHYKTKKNHSV
jgi:hypothetical protein